jgi:general stress protein YciG
MPDGQVTTVREAGSRGGRATAKRYGSEHFRRIGALGGKRTKELYADLLKELGRKGGRPPRPALEELREEAPKMEEESGRSPAPSPSVQA